METTPGLRCASCGYQRLPFLHVVILAGDHLAICPFCLEAAPHCYDAVLRPIYADPETVPCALDFDWSEN